MNLTETNIAIGLEHPFSVLHLTDTHIAFADARDNPRKQALAAKRAAIFDGDTGDTAETFKAHLAYAKAQGLPLLHTGDLIDFVSYANLEFARDQLAQVDYFMATGNHEFSQYVGEAFEDLPYKMQSYDLVQAHFQNNLLFDSRVIGGVNFVAVDDGYYLFADWQRERLQEEVAKGLPIVLMLHNPLHTQELYDHMIRTNQRPCAYLTGTPEALCAHYPEQRYLQQRPDGATLAFLEYVYATPSIRAVLAGHLHVDFETTLPSGIPQYVTGGGYRGMARRITFL